MEVFHKFYTSFHPLAEKELQGRHCPDGSAGIFLGIVDKLVFEATRIYTRDIMKDKFRLDIDLSDRHCVLPTEESLSISPPPVFPPSPSSCAICGEARLTHQCHIIPRHQGGFDGLDNYVTLCPNHHVLFDSHRLSRQEWMKLTWENKDPRVKRYAETVRYCNQLAYWKYGDHPDYICNTCADQDDFDGHGAPAPLPTPSQKEIDECKPRILQLIREMPGILQMDVKGHFLPEDEYIVGYSLSQLKYEEQIRRGRKGRSFELYVAD